MKEIIKVKRLDFDNLENHSPYYVAWEKYFEAAGNLTAHGIAREYFKNMPPVEMYLGWDQQVYPQFKIETIRTNEND